MLQSNVIPEMILMKKALIVLIAAVIMTVLGGCSDETENYKENITVLLVSTDEDESSEESVKEPLPDEKPSDAYSTDTPENIINRELSDSVPRAETKLDKKWFDDAVFVGDSVTLKLSYYAENGELGDAQFLCAGSLGYGNSLMDINAEGNVHPMLGGTKVTVDNGVYLTGRKKVLIMLGMNDIGLFGVDDSIENMKELVRRILDKQPDSEIYIQSVTPNVKDKQGKVLNNKNITLFNQKLKAVCDEKGLHYLHVAKAVSDKNGDLVPEYCSDPDDMGIHFTEEGCRQWIEYLFTHISS